jgi:predicted  nucleic acid-binding Zn-ribbon protein
MQAQKSLSNLQQEYEESRSESSRTKDALLGSERQCSEARVALERAKLEAESVRNEVHAAHLTIKNTKAELDAAEGQISAGKSRENALQERIRACEGKIAEMERSVMELRGKLEAETDHLHLEKQRMTLLENEAGALKNALDDAHARERRLHEERGESEARIVALKSELCTLENEKSRLEAENQGLRDALERGNKNLEMAQGELQRALLQVCACACM